MTEPKNLSELLLQLKEENVPKIEYKTKIDAFIDFKAREQGVPMNGHFELTPLCNLDCKMCYVHLNKAQLAGSQLLSVNQWKDLMFNAVQAGMTKADLSGGECLTYSGFDELYLYLHSFGVEISVKTNGLLLDEKRIEFFKNHPPENIQITLYGSSENGYESVTGHRCFERILNNLKMAKEAELPICIAITPNRFMTDGEDTLRLAYELGFPYTINAGILEPREETGRNGQSLDTDFEEYIRMYKLSRKLFGKEVVPNTKELPDRNKSQEKKYYGLHCAAGRSAFHINWQGKMQPCVNFHSITAEPLKDGFENSWKKINYESEHFPIPMECEKCDYYNVCIHCPIAHEKAPLGHADTVWCMRGRRMVEEGISFL